MNARKQKSIRISKSTRVSMSGKKIRVRGGFPRRRLKGDPRKVKRQLHRMRVKVNPRGVRIVYNKLLGGWYVVTGPHQTPLNGRFNSKYEAEAWLNARKNPRRKKVSMKKNPARKTLRAIPRARGPYYGPHETAADSFANAESRASGKTVGRHVCVQLNGRTVMQSKDSPELRAMAKRYAKTLARKHRGQEIKVLAY